MKGLTALAAVALLLAGCSSWQPQPSPTADTGAWQARAARLQTIERFELQGRAADGRGVKADLRWQQHVDNRFDLRLSGPFGAGAVAIAGTPQAVEVRTRDGRFETRDPEGWLRQNLGWAFPVTHLRYWALGLPAPDASAQISLDAQGRLAVLSQDGWTLQYSEYTVHNGFDLPRRFEAQQGEVRLRLIVDRWAEVATAPANPR